MDEKTSQKRTVTVAGKKEVHFTPRYSLDEFLQGRENEEVYEVFMSQFVWCVVARKTEWNNTISLAENDKDVCTVSDEAFASILLENNWNRWIDVLIYMKAKYQGSVGRKGERMIP